LTVRHCFAYYGHSEIAAIFMLRDMIKTLRWQPFTIGSAEIGTVGGHMFCDGDKS
jgi:hypothetical protein